MPQNMPRDEDTRTAHRLAVGGVVVAIALLAAVVAWPLLPGVQPPKSPPTATTGARSNQIAGESATNKRSPQPRDVSPGATAPSTVGRALDIERSTDDALAIDPAQRAAVKDFYSRHAQDRVNTVDFTISMGAAVPEKVQLRDVPISLADALSAYSGDQYFMVPNRFVIVGKLSRRIVAIIPL